VVTLPVIHHQVAIAGRVIDAQAQLPMAGVIVSIADAPAEFTAWLALKAQQYGTVWAAMLPRADRALTGADGHFHFIDLPDGAYTLAAGLPGAGSRYAAAQATATVSRDGQGNLKMAAADMSLPATTVNGRIAGQNNAAVAMAQVRVQGSGEQTFSDGEGQYVLAGLETGNRTLLVAAQGYKPASQTVQLGQSGAVQTLNFVLAIA
jgi:hypothetical protein